MQQTDRQLTSQYPIGYSGVRFDDLPPLCRDGEFCPDEGDHCMQQSPPGGPCQKDRDEQCQPPPHREGLATYLNVNGSICLNFQCYWANVSAGEGCIVENTQYISTADDGTQFSYVVSRDNCAKNYYCDGSTLQCNPKKKRHEPCGAPKECMSYNCQDDGKGHKLCGKAADEPLKPQPWVYVVIGLAIVIVIAGVMAGLWLLHRKAREENQIKLENYYNEQIAYRQSIMSMSHAKNSLLSLPAGTTPEGARASLYEGPNGLLPPNIRRESTGALSEDSEVLLHDQLAQASGSQPQMSQARHRGYVATE